MKGIPANRKLWLCLLFITAAATTCLLIMNSQQVLHFAPTKYFNKAEGPQDLSSELVNIPVSFLNGTPASSRNRACAPTPSLYNLAINNFYWQTFETNNLTFQLLGAYYDDRMIDSTTASIRIIGMIDAAKVSALSYCQLWISELQKPIIVKVQSYQLIWREYWLNNASLTSRMYHPYLLTCPLPSNITSIPQAVSLVTIPCQRATNIIKVNPERRPIERQDFVVCVKGLDFLDVGMLYRLVEWIELLRILGANKIVFYRFDVHPQIQRVLEYYLQQQLIEMIPISLPGNIPNLPVHRHLYLSQNRRLKRFHEMAVYNDCFYRNFKSYKYVINLDTDEIIMPVGNTTGWAEVIKEAKAVSNAKHNRSIASYHARHIYFFDENVDSKEYGVHLEFIRHIYRAAVPNNVVDFTKSFSDTDQVVMNHNHLPISCVGNQSCYFEIPQTIAQLNHYRETCEASLKKKCDIFKNQTLLDENILKYKDELIRRTSEVFRTLGLS